MPSKTFNAWIFQDDGTTMTGFEVPFDPKPVFGKVRAPVTVTINKHSYRSTICAMGGKFWLPLRKSNREPAGVKAGDNVQITLTLDQAPRTVTAPNDLLRALKAAKQLEAFQKMSFTHQREHVQAIEEAKKPETRERRIAACVSMVETKAKTKTKPTHKAGQKKPKPKKSPR